MLLGCSFNFKHGCLTYAGWAPSALGCNKPTYPSTIYAAANLIAQTHRPMMSHHQIT
jgi:hypothetical protein